MIRIGPVTQAPACFSGFETLSLNVSKSTGYVFESAAAAIRIGVVLKACPHYIGHMS